MSRPLCAAEREVVLTVADDEDRWHVHTDSARLTRRLLRVAQAWGAQVERVGVGYRFGLPLRAVRFAVPRQATAAQREALRQGRHRKPSPAPEGLDNPGGSEGSGPEEVS